MVYNLKQEEQFTLLEEYIDNQHDYAIFITENENIQDYYQEEPKKLKKSKLK